MNARRTIKFAVPAIVLVVSLVLVSIAFADHDLGLFELDRNAVDNGIDPGEDWNTLYDSGSNSGGTSDAFTGILPDIVTLDYAGTQFHGGGSKDNHDIPDWRWNPGEPLDKDDITNAYAAAYLYEGPEHCPDGIDPGDDSCTEPGDMIIYYGMDRFANNGSAQIGFWFFQSPVGLTNIRANGGYKFSGDHTIGDLLIQSNFSQGGIVSSISVYQWVGSGGSHDELDLVYNAQDCIDGTENADLACATVNRGDQSSPWPFVPKFGSAGTFPQGSFFEGGVNVSALVPGVGCFSGFLAETRSSTPFDSRLKDFVLGNFSLCHIDGTKYLDINGNGTRDEGEPPLENWEIQLGGAASDTTYTDSDGNYSFEDLGDGNYTVTEICPDEPPPWVQTEPGASNADACGDETYSFDIDLTNTSEIADFGNGVPAIDITKTCTSSVFVGDDIDYEITVENTGNVNLVNVDVSDTLLGSVGSIALLEPGDSQTFTPFYTTISAGTVENTASADGDFGGTTVYAEVSDSEDCTAEVYELTVTKTADEFYRRYFEWDITKDVTPGTWYLFTGETGTSEYTVNLDQTGYYENDWQVTGSITIDNPAPMDASLASVTDDAGGITGTVSCPSLTVPAEGSLVCTYDTGEQDSEDDNPFGDTNTATATLNNNGGGTTDFYGTADIDFTEATVELVDEEATVGDTYVGSNVSGTYTDDASFTYTRDFTCDDAAGTHNNTASFETNDTPLTGSGDASVTVNCYDLSVSKTADEFYSRYYLWRITKSVFPETWDLFTGESGTSEYTVFLDKTGSYDDGWQVTGEITINNSHPTRDADLTGVVDDAGGITGVVDCGGAASVPAGGTLVCTYATAVFDGETYKDNNPFGDTNTATATQQLYDFDKDLNPTADGTKEYSGTATIDFDEATVEPVDDEATVSDTVFTQVTGTFTDDHTFTYTDTFTCDDNEGQHDNIASFETNDTPLTGSDDASVTVNCYDLSVEKTADTSFDRQYHWTIDKVVDNAGPIQVAAGESVDVNYTVTVDLDTPPYTDNNWAVSGDITVYNSHPTRDAELTQLVDTIGVPFTVDAVTSCLSLVVPAGGSLTCSYSRSLSSGSNAVNTATATQQLYDFDKDLNATADGTKDYSGTANVDFSTATINEIDESVDVVDSYAGYLGTVNASDTLPAYFYYLRTIIAPEDQCGDFQVDNTATFTTNDTGRQGSDDASVVLTVPCEGCTPGFWQGGAGSQLWNVVSDPDWTASGGMGTNPYIHTTPFNDFFTLYTGLNGFTMLDLVGTGGGADNFQKAARDTVAAYLNASWGMAFPYEPGDIWELWDAAVSSGDFAGLHSLLASANDPKSIGGYCPISGTP